MRLFELESENEKHVFDVEKICEMRTSDTDARMWAKPYFITINFYNYKMSFTFEKQEERDEVYNKILNEMREVVKINFMR